MNNIIINKGILETILIQTIDIMKKEDLQTTTCVSLIMKKINLLKDDDD